MSSVSTSRYLEPARKEVDFIHKWASSVDPLGDSVCSSFLNYVENGLEREKKGKRVHGKRYITKMLIEIEKTLLLRNELIREMKHHAHPWRVKNGTL